MDIKSEIRANADLCVKCGFCLPHCPTYNKTGNENESPRGRISLIQAWSEGKLPASEKLLNHIDNCLLCRSCEKTCPAKVPYGKLVDDFRSCTRSASGHSLAFFLLKKIAHNPRLRDSARSLLNFYQKSGLQDSIFSKRIKLGQINRILPSAGNGQNLTGQQFYPAEKPVQGEVGLFQGCMGSLLDRETVSAAIRVLNKAGFNVYLPIDQVCCGALDLHSGDAFMADKLATRNADVFSNKPLDAIVTIASGCGATLQEYERRDFTSKVIDISHFLLQQSVFEKHASGVLEAKIIVHSPCTLRNVMGTEESSIRLLKQIPGLEVFKLPDEIKCCGSAGSYMLEHPEMAAALLDDLLQAICGQAPDYVVSSNIGCALHITAGMKEKGIDLKVVHPVVLIDRVL